MAGLGQATTSVLPAMSELQNIASKIIRLSSRPASEFTYRYALIGGNWDTEVFPGRVVYVPEEPSAYLVSARPTMGNTIHLLKIDGSAASTSGKYYEVPIEQVMGGEIEGKVYAPMMVAEKKYSDMARAMAPLAGQVFEDNPTEVEYMRGQDSYAQSILQLADGFVSDFATAMAASAESNPITVEAIGDYRVNFLCLIASLLEATNSVGAAFDAMMSGPRRFRLLMTVSQAKLKKAIAIYELLEQAETTSNISYLNGAYKTAQEYQMLTPLWADMQSLAMTLEYGTMIEYERQARALQDLSVSQIDGVLSGLGTPEEIAAKSGMSMADVTVSLAAFSYISGNVGSKSPAEGDYFFPEMTNLDLDIVAWQTSEMVKMTESRIAQTARMIRQPVPGVKQGVGLGQISPIVEKSESRGILEKSIEKARAIFSKTENFRNVDLKAKAAKMVKIFTDLRTELFRDTQVQLSKTTKRSIDVSALRDTRVDLSDQIKTINDRLEVMDREPQVVKEGEEFKKERKQLENNRKSLEGQMKDIDSALSDTPARLAAVTQDAAGFIAANFERMERDPSSYVDVIESLNKGLSSEDFMPAQLTRVTADGREVIRSKRLADTFADFVAEIPLPKEEAGSVMLGLVTKATRSEATAKKVLGLLKESYTETFDTKSQVLDRAKSRYNNNPLDINVKAQLTRAESAFNGVSRVVEGIDAALAGRQSEIAKKAMEAVVREAREAELSETGKRDLIDKGRLAASNARIKADSLKTWVTAMREALNKKKPAKKEITPKAITDAENDILAVESKQKQLEADANKIEADIGKVGSAQITDQQMKAIEVSATREAIARAAEIVSDTGESSAEISSAQTRVKKVVSRLQVEDAVTKWARRIFWEWPFFLADQTYKMGGMGGKIAGTFFALVHLGVYVWAGGYLERTILAGTAVGGVLAFFNTCFVKLWELFTGSDLPGSEGSTGGRFGAVASLVGIAFLGTVIMAGPRMFPLMMKWVEKLFTRKRTPGRPAGPKKPKVPGRGPGRPRKSQIAKKEA